MNILFFDTETTGLPKNYKAKIEDLDNWPRVVQLGFSFYSDEDHFTEYEFIIRPDGYEISEEVSLIHGITHERAMKEGVEIRTALDILKIWIDKATMVVGHNVSFDRKVVGAEFLRAGMPDPLHGKPRLCTMMASTRFCNLPGKYGPKWPKLEELAAILYDEQQEGLHSALADVRLTARCFYTLKRKGVISDEMIESALNYTPAQGF